MRRSVRRHTAPIAFHGPLTDAPRKAEARKVVGALVARLALSGAPVGRTRKALPDGSIIDARWNGTLAKVWIGPATVTEEPEPDVSGKPLLWLPRGFLVYPANDLAPFGWGFPVVKTNEDSSDWDEENLAPGLDVARWTPSGALGGVLLTRLVDGGFPARESGADYVAPLMYSASVGPRVRSARLRQPVVGETWHAFRPGLDDMSAGGGSDWIQEFRRRVFTLVNAHRVGLDLPPVLPSFRWRCDSAQVTAATMASAQIMGHYSDQFWAQWQTPYDRALHDGAPAPVAPPALQYVMNGDPYIGENVYGDYFPPREHIGDDPAGIAVYKYPTGGPTTTAQRAFDGWINSPPHRANIESTALGVHPQGVGAMQVGVAANMACQHFLFHTTWLAAGNRVWRSEHPEIPEISWFGWPSVNLQWEAMDGYLNNAGDKPFNTLRPLINQTDAGTWKSPVLSLKSGQFTTEKQLLRPTLSPFIFCRGRAIARVPGFGFVLGAGVHKRQTADDRTVYRLIAIVHDRSDNETVDIDTYGPTPKIRIWYCDVVGVEGGLVLNPTKMIDCIKGENNGWADDVIDAHNRWEDGGVLDVSSSDGGTTIDLLRYASQWTVSPAGTEAISLRTKMVMEDYKQWRRDPDDPLFQPGYVELGSSTNVAVRLSLASTDIGVAPTLTVAGLPASAATVSADYSVDPRTADVPVEIQGTIIAAGYGEDGAESFALRLYVRPQAGLFTGVPTVLRGFVCFTPDYDAVVTEVPGYSDPQWTLYTSAARAAAGHPHEEQTRFQGPSALAVLNMSDRVMIHSAIEPMRTIEITEGGGVGIGNNGSANPCWTLLGPNREKEMIAVRAWRAGILLGTRWHKNVYPLFPNGSPESICYQVSWGPTYLQTYVPFQMFSASPFVVPSYARVDDDWLLAYCVQPDARSVTFAGDSTLSGCLSGAPCRPFPTDGIKYGLNDPAAAAAGFAYSSIGSVDQLADICGTGGSGAFFIDARGV